MDYALYEVIKDMHQKINYIVSKFVEEEEKLKDIQKQQPSQSKK